MWPVARRLVQRHVASSVELGPLRPDMVRALVAECLGDDPPPGVLEAVAIADGVPLFIEELLAAYEQRGDLSRTDQGWRFRPTASALPASLRESVAARLDELGGEAREVIEAAALLGREFDPTLLPPALSREAAAVDEALRASVTIGLLARADGGSGMRFAHALVRDAVAASATGSARPAMAVGLLASLAPSLGQGRDLELGAAMPATPMTLPAPRACWSVPGDSTWRGACRRRRRSASTRRWRPGRSRSAACGLREALLEALALAGDAERASREGEVVRRQLVAVGASADRRQACVRGHGPGRGQRRAVDRRRAGCSKRAASWWGPGRRCGRWSPSTWVASTTPSRRRGRRSATSRPRPRCARRPRSSAGWPGAPTSTRPRLVRPRPPPRPSCTIWRCGGRGRCTSWRRSISSGRSRSRGSTRRARAAVAAGAPGLAGGRRLPPRRRPRRALRARAGPGRGPALPRHRPTARRPPPGGVGVEPHRPGPRRRRATGPGPTPPPPRRWRWRRTTRRSPASPWARPAAWRRCWPTTATVRSRSGRRPSTACAGSPPGAAAAVVPVAAARDRLRPRRRRRRTGAGRDRHAGAAGRHRCPTACGTSPPPSPRPGRRHRRRRRPPLDAADAASRRSRPSPATSTSGAAIAAEAAIADGWGDPPTWLERAGAWFAGRGFDDRRPKPAGRARPPRRGPAAAPGPGRRQRVPADLDRLGRDQPRGRRAALLSPRASRTGEIAERLYLSPRTVKGYVESLLAKTGGRQPDPARRLRRGATNRA